jgi:drug/metabolite transporter (DMT)-like permease
VFLALVQLALTMMMVGANVVVGKLLALALPVPVVLFLRTTLAAAVLAPLAMREGRGLPRPAVLWNLVLQAALGTVAYNTLLLAGLRHTGALEAGLVLSILPAVVAVGAALILREKLSPRRWAAALLAACGMAALALGRGGSTGGSYAGDILVFGSVLAETAWILLSRANAGRIGVMRAAFWMQVSGMVMMAPVALPLLPQAGALSDWRIAGLLVLHTLTASVASVILWFSGMRRAPANLGGIFSVLLPATAAALAVLVLGETLTQALAGGFALTLASILLATWPGRGAPMRPRSASSVPETPA